MITVITGPPCAGKTTYMSEHAKPDDVVIDYDTLAQSLGSEHAHGHSAWVSEVAAAAWSAAVRRAVVFRDCDVWIIDSCPTPARARSYEAAGAVHVDCNPGDAELQRRKAVRVAQES